MHTQHLTPRRHNLNTSLLATVACLVGLGIAMACAETTSAQTATATKAPNYPKAGVILWTKLGAHKAPTSSSPIIKLFPQFRPDFRPTTVLVLGEAKDAKGNRWLKLSLPMRPNGRIGWVKSAAVQTRAVNSRIVVDLSSRTLRVLQGTKTRFVTRVAIGRRGTETPTGNYYLTASFKPTETFLGAFAFETSAYSKLSEWPGGGIVGLHGTSMPELLGKAVSHGCVRMSNDAALTLKQLTPAGTPLNIRL